MAALVAIGRREVIGSGSFDEPDGATPLDPDYLEGLIPTWVATREDLNVAEQANVLEAIAWASTTFGQGSVASLMTDASLRSLHKHMFGAVWKWAGTYRRSDTNFGVHWPYISTQVRDLLADVTTQTSEPDKLPWSADELAVRFHHRLVVIHPFPNGNGRHARLAADLLVEILGQPAFTWGHQDLTRKGAARAEYLGALRQADLSDDFRPLTAFARL